MELRFGDAARKQMVAEGLSRLEIEAVVATPDSVTANDEYIRYDGGIGGRALTVYVRVDLDPPMVYLVEVK